MERDEALSLTVHDLPAEQQTALLISACREVTGMYEWLCEELEEEISQLLKPPTEATEAEKPAISADRGKTIELFYGENSLQEFWETVKGGVDSYLIMKLFGVPGWTVYRDLLLVPSVEPNVSLSAYGNTYLGGPTAEAAAMHLQTQYGVKLKLNRERLHPWPKNQATEIPPAPEGTDE